MKIETSCFDLAMRYVGMAEVNGSVSNPAILAMLRLDQAWPAGDEVPWCSAFVNWIAWHLRLPRSKKLNARSWLEVGRPIEPSEAEAENDVVILSRGTDPAAGHVGFYAGRRPGYPPGVMLLGGNQGDAVSIASFDASRILGFRRLT